jgi:hypothetical protein
VRRIRASNGEYFIKHKKHPSYKAHRCGPSSVHSFFFFVEEAVSCTSKMQSYSVLHSASLPFAFLCRSLLAGFGNH